jgi:hypothetical protein
MDKLMDLWNKLDEYFINKCSKKEEVTNIIEEPKKDWKEKEADMNSEISIEDIPFK